MNWKKTARWSWLVLPFLLLAVWPGLAAAADATLYEVAENLKLKPLTGGHRIATATLAGTVNALTSICPLPVPCAITATATDNISLVTGQGPVEGEFAVLVQGDNPVDGAELMILRGHIRGEINLSLAVLGPDGIPMSGDELPLGSISGKWSAKGVGGGPLQGVHVRGTFTGTFRLPFDGGGVVLYLADNFTPFLADPATEFSLGVPTVRLELTFTE